MLPALKPGQKVLCFNWSYLFCKPKVGNIVAVKLKERKIIKRLSKVGREGFFLEGDNKEESHDSRNFGPVKRSQIIGKISF